METDKVLPVKHVNFSALRGKLIYIYDFQAHFP